MHPWECCGYCSQATACILDRSRRARRIIINMLAGACPEQSPCVPFFWLLLLLLLLRHQTFLEQLKKAKEVPPGAPLRDHRPLLCNADDYLRMVAVPQEQYANFRDMPGVVTHANGGEGEEGGGGRGRYCCLLEEMDCEMGRVSVLECDGLN